MGQPAHRHLLHITRALKLLADVDAAQELFRMKCRAFLNNHKIGQQHKKRERPHCVSCQQNGALGAVMPRKRCWQVGQAVPVAEGVH
jgi:hypothetical protein